MENSASIADAEPTTHGFCCHAVGAINRLHLSQGGHERCNRGTTVWQAHPQRSISERATLRQRSGVVGIGDKVSLCTYAAH